MPTRKDPNPIYIDSFMAGLYTNRSPLAAAIGEDGSRRLDVLIDGSNVEITPRRTYGRRPGFPTYCSATFGVSEWPLNFWSGRISSTLYNIVDTQTDVKTFNTTTLTSIYTKSTTAQTFFQQVGSTLYFSDGTVNKKWDGSTVTNSGITAPTSAPAVANLNFHDSSGHVQTVHAWSKNYSYAGPSSGVSTIWLKDPNGNMQFAFLNPTQTAVSGNSAPTWSTTTGGTTRDGDLTWTNSGPIGTWATGMTTFKTAFGSSGIQNLFSGPNLPTAYTQSGSTAAWSGTLPAALVASASSSVTTKLLALDHFGFAVPTGCTIVGVKVDITRHGGGLNGSVTDAIIKLLKAGVASGSNKAASGAWGNASTTKTYGSATDMWGTTLADTDVNATGFGIEIQANLNYAGTTKVATLSAVNMTVYYTVGSITGAYTSTVILDSNGNLQRISTSGAVGGSAPSWSTQIGGSTTDSSAVWECLGTGLVLAAFVGWNYAYGFHTASSHISTMSPQLSLAAPIIGTGVTLTGLGSSDTQCDRNDLYRNTDGGPLLFSCASDNNVDGSTSWSIFDNIQDADLDQELVGPIFHVNDPPPSGLTNITFYLGRLWGFVGNLLYFSAGPDCTNGDGFQSWPPANVFSLPSNGIGLAASSQGLVVLTSDTFGMILGGPQTLTFFYQPILQNFGILSPNCLAQDADTLYLYTSSRQMMQMTFSGKSEIGFAVSDVLQSNFDPSASSLALHRSGPDEGIFLSDGTDNVIRFSLRNGTWCPLATIVGGIGHIQSVETVAGTYTLVAGRAAGSGHILGRSLTTFNDGGTTYSGYTTFGSMVLSPPGTGTVAHIQNITLEYPTTGTDLTLSVLPNEVSGNFTSIPFGTTDPYQLTASSTISMRRHDWLGVASAVPDAIKHLQLKVSFPQASTADELVGLGIIERNV